jgi:hypothetical protein
LIKIKTNLAKIFELTRNRLIAVLHFLIGALVDVYVGKSITIVTERFKKSKKSNEVTLFCVVKNGGFHIDHFVAHHKSIGIQRMVFLDNGSDDDTVEKLMKMTDVNVLSSKKSFRKFEINFKRCIAKKYCGAGWALNVDIDERFDYPYRNKKSLSELISYLADQKVNAVLSYMLDVFHQDSDGSRKITSFVDNRYYNVSAVQSRANGMRGALGTPKGCVIPFKTGGIRLSAYGANPWLLKTPLFRPSFFLNMTNAHYLGFARSLAIYADFSALLIHYKFVDDYIKIFLKASTEGNYDLAYQHYQTFENHYKEHKKIELYNHDSKVLTSIESLIDEGFLVASEKFKQWGEHEPISGNETSETR